MKPFETGLHGDTEQGPIDLGLIVTADGLGVALDAPWLGQLRAAFDVDAGGDTRLTSLSREGRPVQGLTDVARLVDLETQLQSRTGELQAVEERLAEAERTLAQHDADAEQRLQQAQSALGEQHQTKDQLDVTRKTLEETETRLRRTQSDLSISKSAFTEIELKLRNALAEGRRNKTLLDETQTRFKLTQADLTIAKTTLTDTEGRLRRVQGQYDQLKDESDAKLGAHGAEAQDLGTRLEAAEAKAAELQTLLEDARGMIGSLEAERDAFKGQASSVELERDEAQRKLQLAEDTGAAHLGRASDLEKELGETKKRLEASGKVSGAHLANKTKLEVELEQTKKRLKSAEAMTAAAATELEELKRRLTLSEQARHTDTESTSAELQQALTNGAALSEQLTAETTRAEGLSAKVKELEASSAKQIAELEEERAGREEMVADLAYIQSQVSDLSSTKGALIDRVGKMTERETKRQRTTLEMSDAVRDAEVVAADRKAMARRQEARAQKLEDQMTGMTQEIVDLRGRAEVAENSVLMLGEQLTKLTAERNSLKVDAQFFQKQIGSMQRLLAQQLKGQPPKK